MTTSEFKRLKGKLLSFLAVIDSSFPTKIKWFFFSCGIFTLLVLYKFLYKFFQKKIYRKFQKAKTSALGCLLNSEII